MKPPANRRGDRSVEPPANRRGGRSLKPPANRTGWPSRGTAPAGRDSRSVNRLRDDRGAASIFVLAVGLVLIGVALTLVTVGAARVAFHDGVFLDEIGIDLDAGAGAGWHLYDSAVGL